MVNFLLNHGHQQIIASWGPRLLALFISGVIAVELITKDRTEIYCFIFLRQQK